MRKLQKSPTRSGTVAAGLALTLAAGGATLVGGEAGFASSHREAPAISLDPSADNTDTYAFVSPDAPDTVTLLANWFPFQEPNGGPNFYPFATNARYNIHVDNDGDAKPDITYRWTFQNVDRRGDTTFLYNNGPVTSLDDPNLLFAQTYTLQRVEPGRTTTLTTGQVAPSFTGPKSMPNYGQLRTQAIRTLPGGGKTYAGAADDSFALDLRVFDLLYGGDFSEVGEDTLKGYNVNTLAIQIPKDALALKSNAARNPVVGVWSTTERAAASVANPSSPAAPAGAGPQNPGGEPRGAITQQPGVASTWRQVSRLGNPLVNEVVAAAGMKDRFNRSAPVQDADWPALVARVTDPEVPKLIQALYALPAPAAPRTDLVQIFLTGIDKTNGPIAADLNSHGLNADAVPSKLRPAEMLRLNMSIAPADMPNRLGVLDGDLQGYPNGRRLGDDVVDIALRAVMGAAIGADVSALAAGDGVDANNVAFDPGFPYVAGPNTRAVNTQP